MTHLSLNCDSCNTELFEELEQTLDEVGLDREDICIVGSTCLAVRGLRTHGDIDACDNPEITQPNPFGSGRYEVLGISDRELFDNKIFTDTIDGWKVIRPEIEYCYKKQRRRDKDKKDVELLDKYKEASDEWDDQLESKYCLSTPTIMWKNFWRSIRQNGLLTTVRRTVRYTIKR